MQQDRRKSSTDNSGHQRCLVPSSTNKRTDIRTARIGNAKPSHIECLTVFGKAEGQAAQDLNADGPQFDVVLASRLLAYVRYCGGELGPPGLCSGSPTKLPFGERHYQHRQTSSSPHLQPSVIPDSCHLFFRPRLFFLPHKPQRQCRLR